MQNPYLPYPVRIDEVIDAVEDKSLKTFKFVFESPEDEEKFTYHAGQFAELSVTGQGEIPIGIASSPTEKGFVMFTVFKVGKVTSHLHNMKAGDIMGVRGPMGNWYPWDRLEGKNVVIIGGGDTGTDCALKFLLFAARYYYYNLVSRFLLSGANVKVTVKISGKKK